MKFTKSSFRYATEVKVICFLYNIKVQEHKVIIEKSLMKRQNCAPNLLCLN